MKSGLLLGVGALIIIGAYFFLTNDSITRPSPTSMSSSLPTITPIEHATGVLTWGDTVVYFDPTGGAEAFANQPKPQIVLVTDIHGDHLSTSTLETVVGNAVLIVPKAVQDMLPETLKVRSIMLANGEKTEQHGISIEATPMYNVPESPDAFHTKGRGNGYLLEKDGVRVLIAGDTGNTPELRAMQHIDIALVPMNLPYTMSVDDAAAAVIAFKPKTVYPYHFRNQDKTKADVERFKELVHAGDPSINVVLASWYPNQ